MGFTLSNRVLAVKYSPGERRIFRALSRSGQPKSSAEITKAFYEVETPFHGRKIVIGLLASLARKVDLNDEPFRICKTNRSGPIPINFWIEPRKLERKAAA